MKTAKESLKLLLCKYNRGIEIFDLIEKYIKKHEFDVVSNEEIYTHINDVVKKIKLFEGHNREIYRAKEFEKIFKFIRKNKVNRYLDIGIGDGLITHQLSKLIKPNETIGIDIKDERDKSIIDKYDFHIYDGYNIPVSECDLITISMVLHHIKDLELFVKNLFKACSDNALIIIRDHNINNETDLKLVHLQHEIMGRIYSEDVAYNAYQKYRNITEYKKLFKYVGFKYINTDFRHLTPRKYNPTKYCYMCIIKPVSIIDRQIYKLFGLTDIKYDDIKTLTYVTPYYQAISINKWISHKYNTDISIVESCGGLGGDTIQFYKNRSIISVISCELNEDRFKAFKYNVNKHHNNKVNASLTIYNDNFIKIFNTITIPNKTIVYLDLPWGGSTYKHSKIIQDLYLSYKDVKYGCVDLINMISKNKNVLAIIFKLPLNFNFEIFTTPSFNIKKNKTVYKIFRL